MENGFFAGSVELEYRSKDSCSTCQCCAVEITLRVPNHIIRVIAVGAALKFIENCEILRRCTRCNDGENQTNCQSHQTSLHQIELHKLSGLRDHTANNAGGQDLGHAGTVVVDKSWLHSEPSPDNPPRGVVGVIA